MICIVVIERADSGTWMTRYDSKKIRLFDGSVVTTLKQDKIGSARRGGSRTAPYLGGEKGIISTVR